MVLFNNIFSSSFLLLFLLLNDIVLDESINFANFKNLLKKFFLILFFLNKPSNFSINFIILILISSLTL